MQASDKYHMNTLIIFTLNEYLENLLGKQTGKKILEPQLLFSLAMKSKNKAIEKGFLQTCLLNDF